MSNLPPCPHCGRQPTIERCEPWPVDAGPQPPKLSPEQVKQAQKMRDKRVSVRTIAKAFKVAPVTIYNHTVGPTRARTKKK